MPKFGETRADGRFYVGTTKRGEKRYEKWVVPESFERIKERKVGYNKKWCADNPDKVREYSRNAATKARREKPERTMLYRVRRRAELKSLAFDLTVEDLVIPAVCPVLGIPLSVQTGTANDNSPECDRIDNRKGYVKGNVMVISRRANRIKNDSTLEELERLVDFYRKHRRFSWRD